jgi:hypothetical protein
MCVRTRKPHIDSPLIWRSSTGLGITGFPILPSIKAVLSQFSLRPVRHAAVLLHSHVLFFPTVSRALPTPPSLSSYLISFYWNDDGIYLSFYRCTCHGVATIQLTRGCLNVFIVFDYRRAFLLDRHHALSLALAAQHALKLSCTQSEVESAKTQGDERHRHTHSDTRREELATRTSSSPAQGVALDGSFQHRTAPKHP